MTEQKGNKLSYSYDYADKCDCSEDDNCGCTFPRNLPHDFENHCPHNSKACSASSNHEKIIIKTNNVNYKKESICTCSEKGCVCNIVSDETTK